MSYVDDRETFFSPDKDTAMSHGMTAQYLNQCVDKRNGMEVVDNDGDTWGWVYDCHKGVGKWVSATTHDKRVGQMSEGMGQPSLPCDYEPYRFVMDCFQTDPDPLEGSIHTPASFTEGMEAHINDTVGDPINPNYYRFPSGAEVIDITENLTSNGGQVVQYVARSTRIDGKNKGDQAENLRKAIWFLRRELSRIEAQK